MVGCHLRHSYSYIIAKTVFQLLALALLNQLLTGSGRSALTGVTCSAGAGCIMCPVQVR